jgi:hypothetical protein
MDTFGGTSEKIAKKIQDLPTKSQHWGPLQKLSPEIRINIINNIIKYVFEDNDEHTYSLAINDESDLKQAIETAIKRTAAENPEFKAAGKWAIKFLVDRLSNKELLGNVKYTTEGGKELIRDKDVTQAEVKIALKKAIQKADEDTLEHLMHPASKEDKEKVEVVSHEYNPHAEYRLKTYDEMASGNLKDDLSAIYERVSGLAGETLTGKEFVKFFERYGFGIKEVKQLLKANVLELAETEAAPGDVSGFDVSEEDYIDNLTKDARKDYESSGFNDRHGIDFG